MSDDADLPLHDEAKARAKWRGEDSRSHEGGDDGASGQASDADAAQGVGAAQPRDPGAALLKDLAERPPD